MKKPALLLLALIAAATPSIATAQSGSGQQTLFQCELRNGKNVRVTAQGGNVFYNYGRGNRSELSLRGSARSGNLFHFSERYFNILHQLRFQNGRHSYIVYSLPGSRTADARGSFGVMVLRDGRRVSDTQCRRETEFQAGFELMERLPRDEERYSAMALD